MTPIPRLLSINAITLATHDMARAVRFYRALGFQVEYGDERAAFTSFAVGPGHLNLTAEPPERRWSWWGRVIVFVVPAATFYVAAEYHRLLPRQVLLAPSL
jgi:catechol 2,3-dioxygenase-like lactoylglutathione lyase family enzyme